MTSVSVIIPSYNNGLWLEKCIQSCLVQKHLLEIIVVDNVSTDHSKEIVTKLQQEAPNLIFWVVNPESGANISRNLGFSLAKGDYIQWLDSDDFLLPGKFEAQIAALEKTKADIAYSDWQMDHYDPETLQITASHIKKNQPYPDFLAEILRNKNWSCPHVYLVRKSFAESLVHLPAWNPSSPVEQDREYFSLASMYGATFTYVPGTYAVYNRWSKGSISGLDFHKRLEYSSLLVARLLRHLRMQGIGNGTVYEKILKTEWLVSKTYHPRLSIPEKVQWSDIRWGEIHWKLWGRVCFQWITGK